MKNFSIFISFEIVKDSVVANTEDQIRSQTWSCRNLLDKVELGHVSLPVLQFFRVSNIPSTLHARAIQPPHHRNQLYMQVN